MTRKDKETVFLERVSFFLFGCIYGLATHIVWEINWVAYYLIIAPITFITFIFIAKFFDKQKLIKVKTK